MMNNSGGWMGGGMGGWMGGGLWFWLFGCLVVAVIVFIVIRLTKK